MRDGIQAARDAEAHHRAAAGLRPCVEQLTQTQRIAAGPHRLDAHPGCDAALAGETGDGQNRGGGIDHGALLDQSGKVRKEARTPRAGRGLIRCGAGLARSRGIVV